MNPMELLIEQVSAQQKFLMNIKGDKPDTRKKAWRLHDKEPREIIECTYGQILSHIEIKSELANMIASIGGSLNRRFRLRVDEIEEAHLGWEVFKAYLDIGILSIQKKRGMSNGRRKKHSSYHITVKDSEALNSIMDLVDTESVELFPTAHKPAEWVSGEYYHETGFPLIKKRPHEDAISAVKEGNMDYLLDVLNKLSSTGWRINKFVFETFQAAKYSKDKTPFKAMKEVDPIKRASLEVEMRAIERLAERNIDNAFYHLYNVDFRGRIYPNTAFLHEQSSDNAKGLLLLDTPVPLGKMGFYWLSVHTANMWGNDKVSLDDRAQWVQDNFFDICSYVGNPMKNTGWMDADKPFCFLACCKELNDLAEWGVYRDPEDFPSCLPIYIDGSNNGVQHLTAMSKDETVAPLVNLVPQEVPGDVYMFIAEHSQEQVRKDFLAAGDEVNNRFVEVFTKIKDFKADINKYSKNPKSQLYKDAMARFNEGRNHLWEIKGKLGPAFWNAIEDKKIWRKTVKRPVMVLGYGGTKQGMKTMVEEDTYDLSEYLRDKDKAWSSYLGGLIYDTCYAKLKGPANLLRMFETLGAQENEKNRHVAYDQIVTGFKVVQPYTATKLKQIELQHGEDMYRISIHIRKEKELNNKKQKQSLAPNIVHSVDAVHVAMYVKETKYPVTVVHDSFGCHAGNMDEAFLDVRRLFIDLYEREPLEHIFAQMDALNLIPKKGNLKISSIMESDYAFA